MDMTQHEPQRMSALLGSVATIVNVRTTSLGLKRIDKEAGIQSDIAHNARKGAGILSVSRLPGEGEDRIKEIRSAANATAEAVKSRTMAWGAGPGRLLANTLIEPTLRDFTSGKAEFDRLVESFKAQVPRLINQAWGNIGTYKVEPPTEEECMGAFSLEFDMQAIPDSAAFHGSNLSKEMEAAIQRRLEESCKAAYATAQQDAIERLAEPLQLVVKGLAKYEEREDDIARGIIVDRSRTFRDSLIGNVQQIATVFGAFNLNKDPSIQKIIDDLQAFDGIEANDLRNSKDLRKQITTKANDILANLGDWVS
jgi:hypothetical protein